MGEQSGQVGTALVVLDLPLDGLAAGQDRSGVLGEGRVSEAGLQVLEGPPMSERRAWKRWPIRGV